MKYSYRTERKEYTCMVCGHRQYDINNICLKCQAKESMYNRRECRICGQMIEDDNIHIQNKATGQAQCKACKSEASRKASAKYYHMKKLRGVK